MARIPPWLLARRRRGTTGSRAVRGGGSGGQAGWIEVTPDALACAVAIGMVRVERLKPGLLRVTLPGCGVYARVRVGRRRAVVYVYRHGSERALETRPCDSAHEAVQWARALVVEWACRMEHEHACQTGASKSPF